MADLVVSYNGTPLNDEQTVDECGLAAGSTLDAIVKLFGGKVHGSLARAGKVKGQTPKVNCLTDRLMPLDPSIRPFRLRNKKNARRRPVVLNDVYNTSNVS